MAATRKLLLHFVHFMIIFVLVNSFIRGVTSKKSDNVNAGDKWKKKDVRDYTDVDIEHLYDQWEEGDDELEEDELPEWKRPKPQIDMSKIDPNNPEAMLQMTKKGQTLMMFATVSGNPMESETETISQLWQGSLFNANYELQRYIVASNRVLFMLKDGSKAYDIKDFLVKQDRCEVVTIEGQDYHGKGSPLYQPPVETQKTKKAKKDKNPTKKKSADDSNETKRKIEL